MRATPPNEADNAGVAVTTGIVKWLAAKKLGRSGAPI
jgi:hypothetical protein